MTRDLRNKWQTMQIQKKQDKQKLGIFPKNDRLRDINRMEKIRINEKESTEKRKEGSRGKGPKTQRDNGQKTVSVRGVREMPKCRKLKWISPLVTPRLLFFSMAFCSKNESAKNTSLKFEPSEQNKKAKKSVQFVVKFAYYFFSLLVIQKSGELRV